MLEDILRESKEAKNLDSEGIFPDEICIHIFQFANRKSPARRNGADSGARYKTTSQYIDFLKGIYFVAALIDPALKDAEKSKFLVAEKIEKFRNFGGVRIEDDVIVIKDGIENMTQIPRSVKEIEEIMHKK